MIGRCQTTPDVPRTVRDVTEAIERLAPPGGAQEWDNVGLLAGDPEAPVHRVLACIDLTGDVVDEAVAGEVEFVLAYHPPIFKPIRALRADSSGTDALVFRCIRHSLAIYSTHTALDAAPRGTNDVIAGLCGAGHTEPLEYVDVPSGSECKLVVFVPADHLETVGEAMFAAGAGRIGDYSHCGFRVPGRGSFFGGDATNPTIGERGRLELVDETRLETVVPTKRLPAVVAAMVEAHPYEEPAFDIYPLKTRPLGGIGRIARLAKPSSLSGLARRLKRATGATSVQIVGPRERAISRVIVVVGAAGTLPFRVELTPSDAIVTGEIRHHDALTIQRLGCTGIALGHWASERPVLASLAARLSDELNGVDVQVSAADRDPFEAV